MEIKLASISNSSPEVRVNWRSNSVPKIGSNKKELGVCSGVEFKTGTRLDSEFEFALWRTRVVSCLKVSGDS